LRGPPDERTQPLAAQPSDPDRRFLPFSVAHAQLGDLLKQGGSSASGAAGGVGGLGSMGDLGGALSGQSITSGSASNVAGLLEFCIKNNYLGGDKAAAVRTP
jgi:hypothetical protein